VAQFLLTHSVYILTFLCELSLTDRKSKKAISWQGKPMQWISLLNSMRDLLSDLNICHSRDRLRIKYDKWCQRCLWHQLASASCEFYAL